MERVMDRCTGHCCKAFTIPYSPDELRQAYVDWLEQAQDTGRKQPQDIWLIYPMARYLGFMHSPIPSISGANYPEAHFYSCKNFDETTGDCTIYEHRPKMCSEYPYGAGCDYGPCSWTEQRRGSTALPVVQ